MSLKLLIFQIYVSLPRGNLMFIRVPFRETRGSQVGWEGPRGRDLHSLHSDGADLGRCLIRCLLMKAEAKPAEGG